MKTDISVQTAICESPRVLQVRGIFDLSAEKTSHLQWHVELPIEERPWNIGLITGPSGCGKTTIARRLWSTAMADEPRWPVDRSILDGFPKTLSIHQIVEILSSVGFSSPPAWLRPFQLLSTGQQFRVMLARHLAHAIAGESPQPIVLDEFTSVVDRTVAQIGSAAVAKTIRRKNLQFVAVTCHEDIEDWLQPDWVYRPAEARFAWRFLQRRPSIALEVQRCRASLWSLFAPHHYLSQRMAPSATCFLAKWNDRPVAFSAWLPFLGAGPAARREHRTVTLPDFQGVGIGNALSSLIGSMWRGLRYRALSTTTHPAMIRSRQSSPNWRMHRAPALAAGHERRFGNFKHATTRLTAGFEYIGEPLPRREARVLLLGHR
jgi:ABC-type lipoprotein export system ATPase subunit